MFQRMTVLAFLLMGAPAFAQMTDGQHASLPPELEGPEFSEARDMPAGNHTFTNDFPVASRVVRNGELSDTYLEEGAPLELSPPGIAMPGWTAIDLADLPSTDLEGVDVYPQAWENLGVMGEIETVQGDEIIVSLPRFAGLLDHQVLLPVGAFTILTPEEEPGTAYRAFLGTTETVLRDLEPYQG
ncbi:hypothetical protein [Pontivivens insulae]|uniref:Uncharacterized protein n=1 Tax=Pontivivens insulae TaxID=1639689 RepID=A0A2R8AD12_9RHOB|nr:hypothetical protein [Pontivivens insulae]RED14063.1 hypothetical protein DFR53_1415 [Pontivivens insulae]SPF30137.1 hypothetical protein POI8812_02469 [Pontivivens insulae]